MRGRSISPGLALLAAVAAALLVVGVVLGGTIAEMTAVWRRQGSYQYAWIVAPTLAYLLWHRRAWFAEIRPGVATVGIALAGLAGLLWVVGDAAETGLVRQAALFGGACAVVLTGLGWAYGRRLAPFMALALMMVPLGDILLAPLKALTVGMIELGAMVAGLGVVRDGARIVVGGQHYIVVEACAGLGYFLVAVFFGLAMSLMIYRSAARILALTAAAGVLGLLANGVRVNAIIIADHLNGTQMPLDSHSYFEWPAVALCFALLFYLFNRLNPEPDGAATAGAKTPAPADFSPRRHMGALALAVTAMLAGPLLWQGQGDGSDAVASDDLAPPRLPQALAGWQRSDEVPGWQPGIIAEGPRLTSASYEKDGRRIALSVVDAGSWHDKISGGAVDLSGDAAWLEVATDRLSACRGEVCTEVRHTKLVWAKKTRFRHVYALYAAGGEVTASTAGLRLRRAWARLSGADAGAVLIALAVDGEDGLPGEEVAGLLLALAKGTD